MTTPAPTPAPADVRAAALAYARAARDAGCPPDQMRFFARAGIVLQPRQLAFAAAARSCDRPGGPTAIGFGGARGGGKSHGGLAQLADDCLRFPGLKCLYLRKVGKAGREAIHDLRRTVLRAIPHEYRAQANQITFPDVGSLIVLGHFQSDKDIDNYLGLEYDAILVEEATQLTEAKVEDIETCLRSSKPGWRPRAYYTTNPGGRGHGWFKRRFVEPCRKGAESATRYIPATVRDNRFVDAGYRDKLERLRGWKRRAWLDGDWDIAIGQFFTGFSYADHVRPRADLDAIDDSWTAWLALDYGFTHYTVAHLFCKDNDGLVRVVDEHAARKWLPAQHADAITAMLRRHGLEVGDLRRIVAGGDVFARDRDGRSPSDDYKDLGLRLAKADQGRVSGAAEWQRRLGDPDGGITPTVSISDRCARLIEQLPLMQHDDHRPEDVLKVDCDEDGRGGDDAYDSARYGLMEAVRPVGGAVPTPG